MEGTEMSVQASNLVVIRMNDCPSHLYLDHTASVVLKHQQYTVDKTGSQLLVHVHSHGESCEDSTHYLLAPNEEPREVAALR